MARMRLNTALAIAFGATVLFGAGAAAARPYIVVRDDGTVAKDAASPPITKMRATLMSAYEATGLPIPEVLSVWTTFPMTGNDFATYIDPRANDVTGVGLEQVFPGDGTFTSTDPPNRAILWHNNLLAIDDRAGLHRAAPDGYARYLFLLELSHLFGPQLAVPSPNPDALVGFPFHWSFFMDAGGSPSGGNVWTDNADGTFTVGVGDPATLQYSMLDLYLWGLAEPSEVPPFGVIEPTDVPATPADPFWGGAYAAHSFPWFDGSAAPFTVTGTRRALTIEDVVAANGPRVPGAGTKTSWSIGIVLMVGADATDAEVAGAMAVMDPFADSVATAFADATRGRGTLEVLTVTEDGQGGGGGAGGATASGTGGGATTDGGAENGGGCDCALGDAGGASRGAGASLWLSIAGALAFARARRTGRRG
jgi:hypothetical protein